MFDSYLAPVLVFALIYVLIGGLTLSRSPSSALNRYFMLFSFTLAVWLIVNHLAGTTNTDYNTALWANRLTFVFGGLTTFSTLLFVKSLVGVNFSDKQKILTIAGLCLVLLGGSSLVVENIKPEGNTYLVVFGLMTLPYFFAVVASAVAAVRILFGARKRAKGSLRAQINIVQLSFGLGLGIILITNAILPLVFGWYSLTGIGSFFSGIFVIGISYAIIKYKLFDIRLVVARSLAYVLSIGSIALLYSLLAFAVIDSLVFNDSMTKTQQQVVYTLLAVVLAFSFQPLKKFFDRVTSNIFYRDAYDPQVLIDDLNQVIVSTLDLNKVLRLSAEVIEKHMKSEFCVFGIQETGYSRPRVVGSGQRKIVSRELDFIFNSAIKDKSKVIISDYVDASYKDLQKKMRRNDFAAVARLTTDTSENGVGFIVLGLKKSGNPYNSQDVQVLEIISNSMVIAIDNALRFEEIQKFNITLQESIDSATRELRRTNEKLKALDETKDEFISMASHQLRTPLTSVKGYLSMVLEGDVGPISAQQEKLLKQAFTSSQRMVYLISDLLNVSRLRTGKFIIEAVPTDLPAIIQGEIDQLRETAEARGVKLLFDPPKSFPVIKLDDTKIRQVIMNFLDNAIYYSPNGGDVKVTLEETPKAIEFKVVDSGIGVPKSQQHQLFGKFYRADNAKRARPDGTGLGLFMAKKVVIAQGGAIIFRSTEGKGSTFGFTFPKSKVIKAGG